MGSIPTGPTLSEQTAVRVVDVVRTSLRILRERPEVWLVGIVWSAVSLAPAWITSGNAVLACSILAASLFFNLLLASTLINYIFLHLQGAKPSFRLTWGASLAAFWRQHGYAKPGAPELHCIWRCQAGKPVQRA